MTTKCMPWLWNFCIAFEIFCATLPFVLAPPAVKTCTESQVRPNSSNRLAIAASIALASANSDSISINPRLKLTSLKPRTSEMY